jgi:hypothetical protein
MGKFFVGAALATAVLLTVGVVRRRERLTGKIFVGAALASAVLLALSTLRHQESLGAVGAVGLVLSLVALASHAQWRATQARAHTEMMEDTSEPPEPGTK